HRARSGGPARSAFGRRTDGQCRSGNRATAHPPVRGTQPFGHHCAHRHPLPRPDRTLALARDAAGRWTPCRIEARMSDKQRVRGRILPREKGAAPLDVVIAVIAFLAALALGASLLADRQAESWREGLAGRLTVQILQPEHPTSSRNLDTETEAALQILRGTHGILTVTPMSD